ncbi:MAG TPA: bifunctional homocysteine S-methyltransferase/methylenetetrahydrofolate reductase [Thermoflexales bacterium]|nr:bifunctional homocysteine S-methyltransferase/methylenetetrahydrofolate reductase [Thermoflexales bacterium]HQZ51900.1 bifunctional homocysteine S-methyltransferase/methylenetetrahydrofolate reductase [Thermoflexales bacterium]HRA52085.1 bifunctional homocysteine S-methyltransferase/methylenetetrahydrofolate reductase [Thermoflexales bacterium]
MPDIRELLRARPLLADGAMGTLLNARGVSFEDSFEHLNLTRPELIADIHRDYGGAGADILETNTFGANRFRLAEHGLENQVAEINVRGAEIAQAAARDIGSAVLIAGSVGPLGAQLAPLGAVRPEDAFDAFYEQISALVDTGVDLLILETFSAFPEIEQAVRAARKISATVPIVAEMTFNRDHRTLYGLAPEDAARKLAGLGVDVIGANCSTGPAGLMTVMDQMRAGLHDAPQTHFSVMPNAGFPETRGSRLAYPATPAYFGEFARRFVAAGVRLLGGCCGTTPEHTRAMRIALNSLGGTAPAATRVSMPAPREAADRTATTKVEGRLADALAKGEFVITVEIEPPKGHDTQPTEQVARELKAAGATMLDIAEAPMARLRMGALALAHRIQERVGVESVLHFPVRGRNLVRVQADLLAAHTLHVRNIFVTMGDPTRIGDYPQANDAHDIVPTGLIQLVKGKFNQGMDAAGSSIGEPCAFLVGCAMNLTPSDMEKEALLLRKKVECGADFALTQPVFDAVLARRFLAFYENRFGRLNLPIFAGALLLASVRHAEVMKNEVPGMYLPDSVIERMAGVGSKTRTEGAKIATELIEELRDVIHGVYIIPTFGRYDFAARVIESARAR